MENALEKDFVALLGVKGGPAIRPGSAMPTSNLLQLAGKSIVVDCGLGVTKALTQQGFDLRTLSAVFITHLHSDHYLELGPLLHTAWTAGLDRQVEVWGPPGLAQYLSAFFASMDADISLRIADEGRPQLDSMVRFSPIDIARPIQLGAVTVRAIRNIHPPLVDSFALCFEGAGRKVVFSGDTTFHPPLAEFAKDADLLIHEAMLAEALPALVARVGHADDRLMRHLLRSHSTAVEAAKIASLAKVKALALNHLIPSDDPAYHEQHWLDAATPHFQGKIHVGRDGLRISLKQ
jgi:ribonuclease BN (tRNA processing enzyme)